MEDTDSKIGHSEENDDVAQTDPCIIPSVHGVVDVEGVQIPERELMGHALMNSINENTLLERQTDITERYAYHRGIRYVNKYARMRADVLP